MEYSVRVCVCFISVQRARFGGYNHIKSLYTCIYLFAPRVRQREPNIIHQPMPVKPKQEIKKKLISEMRIFSNHIGFCLR